jgi:ribosomal protein L4
MKLDVVNTDNKKVGSLELKDEVFAGRVNSALIWESVVHANASVRRGTHASKNRALVSGGGKKPYKQKGTGRPQVGSSRTPLWRHGGTVFGPQPRSYDYALRPCSPDTWRRMNELAVVSGGLARKKRFGVAEYATIVPMWEFSP